MSTITISPGSAAGSVLASAVSAAAANTEIILADGLDATLAAGIEIKAPGVTLRAATPGKATIRFTGELHPKYGPDSLQAIRVTGKNVTLTGINFVVAGSKVIGVAPSAANITLADLTFDGANTPANWTDSAGKPHVTNCGCYYGVQVQNVAGVTLRRLKFGQLAAYGILMDSVEVTRADGTKDRLGCSDVTIEDLRYIGGSVFQHNLRAIRAQRVTVTGGSFIAPPNGPGIKHTGGASIRDGCEDWTFTGTPQRPLYIDNPGVGGQNADELPARNIRFNGCTIGGKVALYKTDGVYVDGARLDAGPLTPAQLADAAVAVIKPLLGSNDAALKALADLRGMVK